MASRLQDFPRPNVAVDLVLLTVGQLGARHEDLSLGVVVLRREDGRAVLPGRFLRERTTIKQTVADLMAEKLHFRPRRRLDVSMLDVYDDPDRDERGWVLAVGYVGVLTPQDVDRLSPDVVEILPLRGPSDRGSVMTPESLAYDHNEMVTTAVRRARRRYERSPDPMGLVRPPYTLTQLRRVHEAVLDAPLKRDTFNRRMHEYVVPVAARDGDYLRTSETVGRPAKLYEPVPKHGLDPDAGPFPLPRSERT